MKKPIDAFLVQGSSRSWKGAADPCLARLDGRAVVEWTLARIAEAMPEVPVFLVLPDFDRGGAFEALAPAWRDRPVECVYGPAADPLARLVTAVKGLPDDAIVARCDAQHCFFDLEKTIEMAAMAVDADLECIKFPDDFPPQFASEVYRVGALRRLDASLADPALRVHPKIALCHPDRAERWAHLAALPRYPDARLHAWRDRARQIYAAAHSRGDASRRTAAGDQSRFHYELAAPYLAGRRRVLEAACGDGGGARFLAERTDEVWAVDCDPGAIRALQRAGTRDGVIRPLAANVTHLPFPDGFFDAVTSFETIEHTDPEAFVDELYRVLQPGGLLVLSTPQNALGRVPLNPHHLREFSLAEIRALCGRRFRERAVIGIKAGRVVIPGDPVGNNTVLVCERP